MVGYQERNDAMKAIRTVGIDQLPEEVGALVAEDIAYSEPVKGDSDNRSYEFNILRPPSKEEFW